MNEQKLKNPGGWDYFDELLARRSTGGMGDAVAFLPARANATNPQAGVEFRHFLADSVSAEMGIRSALAGTSTMIGCRDQHERD